MNLDESLRSVADDATTETEQVTVRKIKDGKSYTEAHKLHQILQLVLHNYQKSCDNYSSQEQYDETVNYIMRVLSQNKSDTEQVEIFQKYAKHVNIDVYYNEEKTPECIRQHIRENCVRNLFPDTLIKEYLQNKSEVVRQRLEDILSILKKSIHFQSYCETSGVDVERSDIKDLNIENQTNWEQLLETGYNYEREVPVVLPSTIPVVPPVTVTETSPVTCIPIETYLKNMLDQQTKTSIYVHSYVNGGEDMSSNLYCNLDLSQVVSTTKEILTEAKHCSYREISIGYRQNNTVIQEHNLELIRTNSDNEYSKDKLKCCYALYHNCAFNSTAHKSIHHLLAYSRSDNVWVDIYYYGQEFHTAPSGEKESIVFLLEEAVIDFLKSIR